MTFTPSPPLPTLLEVVIEIEDLAATVHAPSVNCDGHAVDGDGDGLGAELDSHALTDVADRHRIEALADANSGLRVDAGGEPGHRRESLDRQPPQGGTFQRRQVGHPIPGAGAAPSHPPLPVPVVAVLEERVSSASVSKAGTGVR